MTNAVTIGVFPRIVDNNQFVKEKTFAAVYAAEGNRVIVESENDDRRAGPFPFDAVVDATRSAVSALGFRSP